MQRNKHKYHSHNAKEGKKREEEKNQEEKEETNIDHKIEAAACTVHLVYRPDSAQRSSRS